MNTITRLFDFPYHQLKKNNLKDCFVTKYNGEWISTSTEEYLNKANAISRALIRLGVNKNDKIALITSTNRTEWNICDQGIGQIGGKAMEGMARQPEAASKIQTAMLIAAAFIEAVALFGVVVAFLGTK